jgi:hypothetical protein
VEETIEHIFLKCQFSSICWGSLNITWQAHGSFLDIIAAGRLSWGKPPFMEVFMLAAWNIWKLRNNMTFNGTDPELIAWKEKFGSDAKLLIHRVRPELHSLIDSIVDSL